MNTVGNRGDRGRRRDGDPTQTGIFVNLTRTNHATDQTTNHRRSHFTTLSLIAPVNLMPLLRLCLTVLMVAVGFAVGHAQRGFPGFEPTGQYPPPSYYAGLEVYRSGDIVSALELFEVANRQGRRTIEGRWLDSIPALAMRAECLYQLGDCDGAAEAINAVIAISTREARWLSRVVWNTLPENGVVRPTRQGLWPAAANINLIPIRRAVQFEAGQVVTEQALLQGGVIEPFNVRVLDVAEVMRGIGTAMHRRRVLFGPLSTDDPLVTAMLASIKYPARLTLPLPRALIGSMRGCGYFAAGDDERLLTSIASANLGGSVHELSPVTLVSALHSAATDGDVSSKVAGAIQSANIAAAIEQTEWVGPSLQLAAGYANADNAAEVGTFAASVAANLVRRGRMASLHAAVAAADAFITAGQFDTAAEMLQSAQQIASRRDVYCPRIEAYAAWVATRLAAATSSGANGGSPSNTANKNNLAVTAAMLDPAISQSLEKIAAFAGGNLPAVGRNRRNRSASLVTLPRIFQQNRLPALLTEAGNSSTASSLASIYLGDPPQWLWRTDPVDALGSSQYDATPLHRVRFSLAMASGSAEDIWRASNDYGRDRFMSRMPIGGRAASVRKMAWAELDHLDQSSRDFIDSSPAMKQLRIDVIRGGGDPAAAASLRANANRIALTPQQIPAAALPDLDDRNPTDGIPDGTAVLSIVQADQFFQFVLFSNNRLRQWRIQSSAVKNSTLKYLSSLGVLKSISRIPSTEKEIDNRQTAAERLTRLMFPDDAIWETIPEERLVIVPDGPLWYLPFELLVIQPPGDDGVGVTIGDRFTVRYSPTIGSIRLPAGPKTNNTIVALGADAFFVPRDAAANGEVIDRLAKIDGVDAGLLATTASSMIGTVAGHTVFAAARVANPGDPLALMPSPIGPGGLPSTLAAWMSFPHAPPASVLMPGLRSGVSSGGDGSEIFMILCGLRVAGVRDAIISRWAVGGDSTASLIEEYMREVANGGPGTAIDRAKTLLRQREINPAAEPLLGKLEAGREDITANEPLFWSGYITAQ